MNSTSKKDFKIAKYLLNKINEYQNSEPQKQEKILTIIYNHLDLQKYKIENNEGNDDYDSKDGVEYYYEEWASRVNNQNSFIELAFATRKLQKEINQNKLTSDPEIERVRTHLRTLINKIAIHLGINWNDLDVGLKEKTMEEMQLYCADAKKEGMGKSLLFAYKNRAKSKLNELDMVFGNKLHLSYRFSEGIEKVTELEEVEKRFIKGVKEICEYSLDLLAIDFYEKSNLLKFIQVLPNHFRNKLYFIENNWKEVDGKMVHDPKWDGYRKLIDEVLLPDQIKELFHNSKNTPYKKKAELIEKNNELENRIKDLSEKNEKKNELLNKTIANYEAVLENAIKLKHAEVENVYNKIFNIAKTNSLVQKDLKQKIYTYEMYTKNLKEWGTRLKNELLESQKDCKFAMGQCDILKNEKDALEKLLAEIIEKKDGEINDAKLHSAKIQELLNKEINRLKEKYNKQIQKLEKTVETRETMIIETITKYEKQIKELEKEISNREAHILNLLDNKGKSKADELIDKENLIAEADKLRKELVEKDKELGDLQSRNNFLQENIRYVNRNISSKVNLITSQQTQIDNLQTQLTELERVSQVYYDTSEAEKKQLQQQVEDEQNAHLDVIATAGRWDGDKIERLEKEKQKLIDIINEKNDEIEDLEVKLTLSELEKDKKSSEHSEEINKLRSHYEKRLDKLKEEIIELGIKNNELDVQKQNELEELKENKNNVIIQQWKKIKYLENQIEKGQKLVGKLRQKNKKVKQEFSELDDQYNKLEGKYDKKYNKLKTRLGEQVNNLHKLAQSKKDLKIELTQKLNQSQTTIEGLGYELEVRTEQRDKARTKLKAIRDNKKKLKEKAQDKGVCMTLIKWDSINQTYLEDDDNSLVEALNDTKHNLVDVIISIQEYLGVDNLTEIETTHKMPQGKSLKDLIEFYNDPPTATPTTTYVEVPKEVPAKPVDTPFGEDLEKIIQIDLNALEKELNIELTEETREKIIKATNYRDLSYIRNQEIKKVLAENKLNTSTQLVAPLSKNETDWKWRWILISLLVIKGIIIASLASKIIKNKNKK